MSNVSVDDKRYKIYIQVWCKCPVCGEGGMHLKEGRIGKFLSCNNFPKCSGTVSVRIDIESTQDRHLP